MARWRTVLCCPSLSLLFLFFPLAEPGRLSFSPSFLLLFRKRERLQFPSFRRAKKSFFSPFPSFSASTRGAARCLKVIPPNFFPPRFPFLSFCVVSPPSSLPSRANDT